MRFYPFLYRHLLVASLLLFTACEDPSNVGLGLVGNDGGEPIVEQLPFETIEMVDLEGIEDNTGQHLVGQVDDPLMGQISATAYIDFLSNTTLDQNYIDGTVSRVLLRLEQSYVYGDTLQEVTVALHEVLNEFSTIGNTRDSIPEVGPEITQFSFMPTDTLVSVEMPADWVSAKDADLRSTSFGSLFTGFQLRPVAGNAIVGFLNATNSRSGLRGFVDVDDETIEEFYVASKSITDYSRQSPPNIPPGRILLQNGIGPKLSLNFDLSQLANVSLNRAVFHLEADTLALTTTPNFVRPQEPNFALYGILGDTQSVLLAINPIDSDGSLDLTSETLRSILQQFSLGLDPYDNYEIRFPVTASNTINALVVHDSTSVTGPPSVVLTYTKLD